MFTEPLHSNGRGADSIENTLLRCQHINSWIADMMYDRKEMTACQGKTEARLDCKEPTREEMESESEQREGRSRSDNGRRTEEAA
jgi:hypothetical protein